MSAHRPYEFYVDMVENRYFGMADKKAIEAVLDCFCEDAVFTIQSAFTTYEGRDAGIRQMFINFFENFSVGVHKDFRHVVDIEHERCSCQFKVELTAPDGTRTHLSNCNFFYFENGKFKRVYVYMSGENVLV
jgi:ketosteroid isomerase-like protein